MRYCFKKESHSKLPSLSLSTYFVITFVIWSFSGSMKGDNFQNLYNKWEHNGHFDHNREPQLVYNHHYEGNSDNGGIFAGLDQTKNYQTVSYNLNLHVHPQQEGSPIGLTLKKSNSLINLVEMTLSDDREQKKMKPEKMKASNFSALLLQIGSWKRISRNEGDLVVKVYYAKKKLVWEFLDGPLKSKIEIQWSEISAIRSFICEGEHGRLEIELNQPPQFGREINPQPRKHTQWKQTTDFTGGQASVCRRHSVIFHPGVLDKQYEKLIQCDNRLFSLNQHPFPVNNYPFFYHDPNHSLHYVSPNIHFQSSTQSHRDSDSNLTSVRALLYSNEGARMHTNTNQERGNNHCGGIPTTYIDVQDYLLPCYGQESWIPVQQSQMKMLNEEIDFSGCVSDGISNTNRLLVHSEIATLEPDQWVGVLYIYGTPWESRMENIWSTNM